MNIFEAIVLAIIEGLTEFLPVSSTGHMILGSALMGLESTEFVKFFTVAIQLGTILSVVVLYFKRFFQSINFYIKLFVAFLPAAIMGLIFSDYIDALLESPLGVAIALLVGGIILLFVDKWFKNGQVDNSDDITLPTAFKIGLFQCLAMIPGMSRSASTIVGGMAQKLTRKAAAEFSFFLAIPTMVGATAKKLLDFYKEKGQPDLSTLFTGEEIQLLLIGNIVGFLVAILAIKTFISFVTKHGFKVFGIYRIIIGAIIILMIASGQQLSII